MNMKDKIPVGIIVPNNQRVQAEALALAGSGALFRRKEPMSEGLLQPVKPTQEEAHAMRRNKFIQSLLTEELDKIKAEPTPKPIPLNVLFSMDGEELDLAI